MRGGSRRRRQTCSKHNKWRIRSDLCLGVGPRLEPIGELDDVVRVDIALPVEDARRLAGAARGSIRNLVDKLASTPTREECGSHASGNVLAMQSRRRMRISQDAQYFLPSEYGTLFHPNQRSMLQERPECTQVVDLHAA
eukprot:3775909-Pyramimonas_sp.AAC.1